MKNKTLKILKTIVKILALPIMIPGMLIEEIIENIKWLVKYYPKIKEMSHETDENGNVISINVIWKDEV
jgi:hypothetical protein